MCTISTSCTSGPRSISASTRTCGVAQPGWMYTLIPDSTQRSASRAVSSFRLYSLSQAMISPLLLAYRRELIGHTYPLVTERRIVGGTIKKLFQQLQHLQFAKDLDRVLHFAGSQEFPKIFFGQFENINDLTEGDTLSLAAGPDLLIAALDFVFALAQKPVTQVAIDFVNASFQFLGGNTHVLAELVGGLHLRQQTVGQLGGMAFDQAYQTVGKQHGWYPFRPFCGVLARWPRALPTPQKNL